MNWLVAAIEYLKREGESKNGSGLMTMRMGESFCFASTFYRNYSVVHLHIAFEVLFRLKTQVFRDSRYSRAHFRRCCSIKKKLDEKNLLKHCYRSVARAKRKARETDWPESNSGRGAIFTEHLISCRQFALHARVHAPSPAQPYRSPAHLLFHKKRV